MGIELEHDIVGSEEWGREMGERLFVSNSISTRSKDRTICIRDQMGMGTWGR